MLNATSARIHTSILPDEYAGGRQAVDLIVGAGFREGIALIGHNAMAERGLFRSATVERRIAGIRDAMTEHGLAFVTEESCWEWEPQFGYELVARVLRQGPAIKALICLNDRLAFGAYQAAAERGLSVPDDISVVSFDNDETAAYLRPGLTTIALPHEQMGREAVRLLLSDKAPGQVLVPMPAIIRASIRG
jgi:LacI family transcriptional regulator